MDFDGPFLPAGRVVFFDLDEVSLLLALLDEVLFLAFVVFVVEDFGLVVELFAFVFEADLLAGAFLVDFAFAFAFGFALALAFAFGLGFGFGVCAYAEVVRQIASKMAKRFFITNSA